MNERSLVVVIALAFVGYLVFKREQAAASSNQTKISDPYTAAIVGATPIVQNAAKEIQQELTDSNSDLRRHLQNDANAAQNVGHALGIAKKANQHKKDAQRFYNAEFATRLDAEKYAARVHTYLSRSDVEQWVIDQDGTLRIFYRGQKTPFIVNVPASTAAYNRIAFAMEPIVRALGVPIQRGTRIGTPFVRHNPPAFSDANPYATPSMTVSGVREIELDPKTINAKAKDFSSEITTRSQSVLKASGLLNTNLIPENN